MEKEKKIQCPICEESFLDLRGITSHARHRHDLTKEELEELLEEEDNAFMYIMGGLGTLLLALLTLGRGR